MPYKYLILDSRGNAVAHGTTEYTPRGTEWRMNIDDGDVDEVTKHTFFSLVGDSDAVPALEGKLVRREGNVLVLEPVRPLEQSVRKNLRIPVRFVSYIYPRSGSWRGRVPIVSYDLSCGGIAFFCPRPLENGEVVQIVIPVTTQPLLVDMRILRRRTSKEGESLYAAEFISLLREEESMIREAVFSLQLQKN
ncbi:PilZ domain-containing protein [uncultured Pseudoflavonifractor sp.]|uniref:PilZ domain-containing protein n=1 Tax=uncultured Pseudoflavonifractor sp. TaxID=1221379 RepID=UPI0025E73BC3|nr:PilZ domain-containing protein [uncultured Pseudoflavonifractor sp.]